MSNETSIVLLLPSTIPFGRWAMSVANAMPRGEGIPPRATHAGTHLATWAAEARDGIDALDFAIPLNLAKALDLTNAVDLAARQWALAAAFETLAAVGRMITGEQAPPLPIPS